MSKLKLYITGLVIASALALVATSLSFDVDPRIAIQIDTSPTASFVEIALGIAFWIVVMLFASALPVQMPGGIPVGTLAIGKPGAANAGLLAAAILALSDEALSARLDAWREAQTNAVAETPE